MVSNNRYGKNQLFAVSLVLKLRELFDCLKSSILCKKALFHLIE